MSQPTQPQQPFGQPPPPPLPIGKPSKQKRFGFVALGLTALISLGVGGIVGGGEGATTAGPAATATVTAEAEPAPTVTVTETGQPERAPATKPKPAPKGLAEGTYQVGVDVDPGRYTTTVPSDSFGSYWTRAKDDSGELDSIIANANADAGARVSVTLKKGEFFTSNGCGDWARQ